MLEVSCFTEAERLYMLVRETAVCDHPLNALVLPEVLVSGLEPLRSEVNLAVPWTALVTLSPS